MEAALLQERFLRLVSLNLVRGEAMRCILQGKGRCRSRQYRQCWCIRGETLPGESRGQYTKGMVEAWDVGEVAGAHGGEGDVYQRCGRDFSESVRASLTHSEALSLQCLTRTLVCGCRPLISCGLWCSKWTML